MVTGAHILRLRVSSSVGRTMTVLTIRVGGESLPVLELSAFIFLSLGN